MLHQKKKESYFIVTPQAQGTDGEQRAGKNIQLPACVNVSQSEAFLMKGGDKRKQVSCRSAPVQTVMQRRLNNWSKV